MMWKKKAETQRLVTDRTKFPMNVTVERGNEGIWKIIRELDTKGVWTVWEVQAHTHSHGRTVRDYIMRLVRGGYAEEIQSTQINRKINSYRLLNRPEKAPRLKKDGTAYAERQIDTLWRSMKMAKTFTASELAEDASVGEHPVKKDTARRYLLDLLSVGIVDRVRTPRGEEKRYRLMHNIGYHAPQILSAHVVFDPNSESVLGEPEAKEVQS
jgi:hypothetical protein